MRTTAVVKWCVTRFGIWQAQVLNCLHSLPGLMMAKVVDWSAQAAKFGLR